MSSYLHLLLFWLSKTENYLTLKDLYLLQIMTTWVWHLLTCFQIYLNKLSYSLLHYNLTNCLNIIIAVWGFTHNKNISSAHNCGTLLGVEAWSWCFERGLLCVVFTWKVTPCSFGFLRSSPASLTSPLLKFPHWQQLWGSLWNSITSLWQDIMLRNKEKRFCSEL